ncbi:hypothetical protein DMH03_18415 [Amycolatopsis sp. WAC 01376]|uniref:hypothetical protein n=1 Tax=Amycolatopsis sp. WAC 01376 TaxID=2203195 RepID=UPI000F78A91A|nr:hypothetical protein [Amycolatopsis sp. WAC 01376]RSM60713.1 hypothetical protein DMH03_18415 [Amycolatopsis sp. WAC 01376]
MVRWIHFPDWGDGTARLLHDTLNKAFYLRDELIDIYRGAGLAPFEVDWGQPAAQLWPTITRDAADAGRLAHLIELVKARCPAVGPDLDAVLAAHNTDGSWYSPRERHLSLLLGPGCQRALLDRRDLRAHLVDLARKQFPVLSITGEPGSGKSYSRHLIQHMAGDPALACEFRLVNVEDDFYDHVDATGFMTALAARLGLPTYFPVDQHTEQARTVRELVDVFVGRFAALPKKMRWIFIDGLDRPQVSSGVHMVVAQLAKEVEAGQLPGARLIVTGHPGDFSPAVLEVLRHEKLTGVTTSHLQGFFRGLADHVGKPISDDELEALVDQVLGEADLDDLRVLGSAACRAAHLHFTPAGAP